MGLTLAASGIGRKLSRPGAQNDSTTARRAFT